MIDHRKRENRTLTPHCPPAPDVTERDDYWVCMVCRVSNHVTQDRCQICDRLRVRVEIPA